jgi:hypothetical protein
MNILLLQSLVYLSYDTKYFPLVLYSIVSVHLKYLGPSINNTRNFLFEIFSKVSECTKIFFINIKRLVNQTFTANIIKTLKNSLYFNHL